MLTVEYEPPLHGMPDYRRPGGRPAPTPITHGPALMRTTKPKRAPRWHRVRSALQFTADESGIFAWDYLALKAWCGVSGYHSTDPRRAERQGGIGDTYLASSLTDDDVPLCGGCEGRAIGAGHDPIAVAVTRAAGLVFSPRNLTPPAVCPAVRYGHTSMVVNRDHRDRGTCLMCGEPTAVRGGYGWTGRPCVKSHPPGPGLVPGCLLHRWEGMRAWHIGDDVRVICICRITAHRVNDAGEYRYTLDEEGAVPA